MQTKSCVVLYSIVFLFEDIGNKDLHQLLGCLCPLVSDRPLFCLPAAADDPAPLRDGALPTLDVVFLEDESIIDEADDLALEGTEPAPFLDDDPPVASPPGVVMLDPPLDDAILVDLLLPLVSDSRVFDVLLFLIIVFSIWTIATGDTLCFSRS